MHHPQLAQFKRTSDSDHGFNIAPNLLQQDFLARGPNQRWAGDITRIIAILPTDQSPAPDVCRTFREATNVTESGLGFTLGDIFIPPHMTAAANIQAGGLVEGNAITSFDKKRGKWGMKAIRAKSVARNHHDFGQVGREEQDDW